MRTAVEQMPRHLQPSFACYCGAAITHARVTSIGGISFECVVGHFCLPVAEDGKVVVRPLPSAGGTRQEGTP